MRRRIGLSLFALALAVLALGWVRGAWQGPLDSYAFDFSINYTGGRLLSVRGADRPLYDRATLKAEAAPYTGFDRLYAALYLTYIQTPISAVVTIPFSRLDFDSARLAFLAFSNGLLVLAAAVMVWVLRPSKLLILAAFAIFATFEPMFESLRLGQVDGMIVLCLALSFWAMRRGPRPAMGAPLAAAAILKLSPIVVVGYCAWRRWWRVVGVAAAALVALMACSVLIAGWDNNVTFLRDMVPHLMRGSPWYYNVSITGAVLRARLGRPSWMYEDEPPPLPPALRLSLMLLSVALVLGAYWLTRRDADAGFMLAIAVAILIAPVAWTSYLTWLLPSLLWLVRRYEDRRAWPLLAALVALYPALAVRPDWFETVSVDLYAVPIKMLALMLYIALLAWEGARSLRPPVAATGTAAGPSGSSGHEHRGRGGVGAGAAR